MKASLLLAAAIATLSLPAMAEVPVPRPNPERCTDLTDQIERFSQRPPSGAVLALTGAKAKAFLDSMNSMEPQTDYAGDTVLFMRRTDGDYVVDIYDGECRVVLGIMPASFFLQAISSVERTAI